MKGYVTNGQPIAGDTVWYVTIKRQIHEPSAIRIRPTRFVRFDTQSHSTKPEEPQRATARLFWTSSDDAIESHLHKFAGVILKAGHDGQSFGGDAGLRLTLN